MISPEQATALRKPFPPESVGKLPKGGAMLDYVGHAAVTDRLLTVDPEWSWEPLALDEHGLPALDRAGNLWIRLTICGVTRIGVGDGKSAKECIGDAIRNAAMRFGVALDLWAKEDLVEFAHAAQRQPAAQPSPTPPPAQAAQTTAQQKKLHALLSENDLADRAKYLAVAAWSAGRPVESTKDLTKAETAKLIDYLEQRAKAHPHPDPEALITEELDATEQEPA